ncbi:endonuclease/exonuclease/phosphatase family protein [Hoeflea ulvae]|uniref:Endonuclease/exonuclease/phosphatase domain-containing protein n=1 Tax=Hoeflea ulvae TaxID=2983764 RepID=A0ABT3YJN9_9HYPH|nr:hypothetical protein [Hoeflea ulvae]MCY0096110.1 hypothetical protein [Hoeflea ulvae]
MAIKLATWNLEWFGQLLQGKTRTIPTLSRPVDTAEGRARQKLERQQIATEIRLVNPDILCMQEGPSTTRVELLRAFCDDDLGGEWRVIERGPTDRGGYRVRGAQGIWFLVRSSRMQELSPALLPQESWQEATEYESRHWPEQPGEHAKKWPIVHPWFKPKQPDPEDDFGEGDPPIDLFENEHSHFRWPQTLVCTIAGKRFDLIGVHLKSKFSKSNYAKAGKAVRKPPDERTRADKKLILAVEQEAVEARVKISTEIVNIRYFIENRFRGEPHPAIFVMGDMNDGVGKEYFERRMLFHDLISNLQGDVFFARQFLNHALFDYMMEDGSAYRWSTEFEDAWEPGVDARILIDHIMFTQAVVGAKAMDTIGLQVKSKAGQVEHAAHVAANTPLAGTGGHTSDHRPVSVVVSTREDAVA